MSFKESCYFTSKIEKRPPVDNLWIPYYRSAINFAFWMNIDYSRSLLEGIRD